MNKNAKHILLELAKGRATEFELELLKNIKPETMTSAELLLIESILNETTK